jgi:hypothetical protein
MISAMSAMATSIDDDDAAERDELKARCAAVAPHDPDENGTHNDKEQHAVADEEQNDPQNRQRAVRFAGRRRRADRSADRSAGRRCGGLERRGQRRHHRQNRPRQQILDRGHRNREDAERRREKVELVHDARQHRQRRHGRQQTDEHDVNADVECGGTRACRWMNANGTCAQRSATAMPSSDAMNARRAEPRQKCHVLLEADDEHEENQRPLRDDVERRHRLRGEHRRAEARNLTQRRRSEDDAGHDFCNHHRLVQLARQHSSDDARQRNHEQQLEQEQCQRRVQWRPTGHKAT